MRQFLKLQTTEALLVAESLIELGFDPRDDGYFVHDGLAFILDPKQVRTFAAACCAIGAIYFDSDVCDRTYRLNRFWLSQALMAKALEKEEQSNPQSKT